MLHIFENVIQELEYKADPEAFHKKLNGQPTFIGQGGCRSVGSDCYGFYLVEKKVLPNGKTIWGYSSAKSKFAVSWTDGSKDCEGPVSWKAADWITSWGKTKSGSPKWWFCDANGKRYRGHKCDYGFGGAYAYRDPSW